MGKFKNKMYRFMYGRYGSDTLNKVFFVIYVAEVVVFTVLSIFTDPTPLWMSLAYLAVSMTLIFIMFFRMFSRNIQKRRRENDRFCGFFKLRKNKFRDRKTHVYKKCPHCKAVLRLPKAKGKHSVICPRCKDRFTVGH